MTLRFALAIALVVSASTVMLPSYSSAQEMPAKFEYIEIRWSGLDGMCVILPDGHVNFIGRELKNVPLPDDVDKRAFYMSLAMNRMAKSGYEFAGMINDEIVMKRALVH